ncbi:MAG: Stk1 family PASTA domain-containing Ser/Thr kinase [Clostridiales Family XIII bacterium]|jgi:serine/threonine-protein kinase|nr:Stk1 family PASTA domain-containing Ser/Thr kinase [Clostridiales Family XIII bacterium]
MSEKILAGRYEIIEKIGDGGMAVVYRGRDRLLNRFVAIKVLRPEYTRDSTFLESFKRESQSAAKLSHPNIVNIYDVGKEGNVNYIVMELVEGRTLSEVIDDEAPLDYKRAINIAKQIASALSLAHKNNIIHRDVKPHNILIMPDGNAKITDFGIAKAVTDATIVEKGQDSIMGSVHYFSPEQARGGYVDEKSDIYSLGIVMYEMLTGKVPFDAENPVTVAVMHMNDRPVPPSRLVSGIPPGLEQIVMKAIEKYQINRFKTADDMHEALENVNFISGIIENPVVAELLRANRREEGAEAAGTDGPDGAPPRKRGKAAKGRDSGRGGDGGSGSGRKGDGRKGGAMTKTRIRILAVALALICAIPASYFIFTGLQDLTAPKETEIPDLIGRTEDEATAELEGLGLKLEVKDLVNSAEFGEGLIVSQERPAGSTAKQGFTVRVNISRGMPEPEEALPVTVPYLIGKSLEDARRIIDSYGYREGAISRENNRLPLDFVVRQSPSAGEEAEAGARIDLVLSDGEAEPENVVVPSLIGLAEDAAKKRLEDFRLTVGAITVEASMDQAAGLVMWQQYEAEAEMVEGSKVDIKLSAGPPSNEPRGVAIDIDFSSAPNEVFNLSVLLTEEDGNAVTVIREELRYKSAGSESVTVTSKGKGTVYVLFNGAQAMVYVVDFSLGTKTLL